MICACRKKQMGREQSSEIPWPKVQGLLQSAGASPKHGAFLKIAKPSQHLLCHVISSTFPEKGCTSLLLVWVQQALSKAWVLGETLAW